MIDYTQDYTELLQYQNLLDTSNPTEAGGTPWVEECLSKVGWKKGDPIPGGMGEYVAAILDHLKLKKTSKNVKDIFNIDEVKASVQGAIRAVYEVKHADEVAKEKAKELMGDNADLDNPLIKKLYDAAVRANEKAITKGTKISETTTVISPEEASTILTEESKKTESVEELSPKTTVYGTCPRCGLNLNEPFRQPELTLEEKRNYLMHVVGGARFYKEYPLWGGAVSVLLQTPTMEEESVFEEYYGHFINQYRSDNDFQKLTSHYQECRLALLLKELRMNNRVIASSPGILADSFQPKDGKTRLQLYIETWYRKTVTSSEMRDALNSALDKYLQDMSLLQQALYSQDFWKGEIAG